MRTWLQRFVAVLGFPVALVVTACRDNESRALVDLMEKVHTPRWMA
jgi:hypothetical protein